MEIKDAIIVAVILMVITVITNIARVRKKQRIGYLSNIFKDNFSFRVGILKIDHLKTFCIVIENKGNTDIVLKNIYIEIKQGNKYNKYELPNTVFDNTKELIIPNSKTGGAMMPEKDFKKIFVQDSEFKAVVVFDDGTILKSQILIIEGKKRELKAK